MSEAIAEQSTLLDLNGRELNAMWVDENAPLFIPNNPLHWKAHKLQVALGKMEKQQDKNPAQFNSTTYFAMLNQYTQVLDEINKETKVENAEQILESGAMVEGISGSGEADSVRQGKSDGMDSGISADNPFARQGISSP